MEISKDNERKFGPPPGDHPGEWGDRHGTPFNPSQHGLKSQAKHLKSYTAYFRFNDGDLPVNIAATDIKEAAKLSQLPGVAHPESMEPVQIKFDGKTVGIAMPVNVVGFDTIITPPGAVQAGACATPEHFDVVNGENVIFSAKEPFGYEFDGWYKTGVAEKISERKTAEIEVYDKFSSKLQYEARFIHKPKFLSGRYLDLQRGNIISFSWVDPAPDESSGAPLAYVTWDDGTMAAWRATVFAMDFDSDEIEMKIHSDPSVVQDNDDINATFLVRYSPVGVNLYVKTISSDNRFGYDAGSWLNLQYLATFEVQRSK